MWKGWDDPRCAPDVCVDATLAADHPAGLRGVGLVPFSVFPHYAPRWRQLYEDNAPALGHECRAVADDAGLVVDGWWGGEGGGGSEPETASVREVGDVSAAAAGRDENNGGAIPDT